MKGDWNSLGLYSGCTAKGMQVMHRVRALKHWRLASVGELAMVVTEQMTHCATAVAIEL
jgi:hypothetical protein